MIIIPVIYISTDRRTYFTINKHRLVKDGGGIDPDLKINAIEVGESILE
jgi:hypothetical protein